MPIRFGAADTAVNSDIFSDVFQVQFDGETSAVSSPIALDLSAYVTSPSIPVAQMTDSPTGATGNGSEFVTEGVGIAGGLKGYLDNQFGVGNWDAKYTGFSTVDASQYTGDLGNADGPDPTHGLDQPIIAINSGSTTQYFVLSTDGTAPTNGGIGVFAPYYYACFEKDTLIATPAGDVLVSELKRGDKVLTQDGRSVDIKWMGYQAINALFAKKHDAMPIRIAAGALGDDLPKNDLYVSPDHAFLIDGLLVNASALVNGESITQLQAWAGNVEYYHIETEEHEIILAEGVPAETLLDNSGREKFANYKEFQELYPEGKVTKELDFPRVKFPRQLPEQIKKKLAAHQGNVEMAA
jgi:hypothetical protein